MKKNLSKNLAILFISTIIVLFASIPASASINTNRNLNSITKPNIQSYDGPYEGWTHLQDGQTISEYIGGAKYYHINVGDSEYRQIFISSTKPIQAILFCPEMNNFISFDSGHDSYTTKMSWSFLPATDYQLLVMSSDNDASISLSMEKKVGTTWVYVAGWPHETKQVIWGQNTDIYNYRFLADGLYKVSVKMNYTSLSASLTSVYGDKQSAIIENTTKDFYINAKATENVADYRLELKNIGDDANTSSPYTITIQKIS